MKKQFAVLALCLTVTMTNNAYSMDDPTDNPQLHRRIVGARPHVENQSQERERAAVTHAVAPFRWSDLNPYTWSAQNKALVVSAMGFFLLLGRIIHKYYLYVPEDTVMGCRPGIDFKLSNTEGKKIIFTEAIHNDTHIICQGVLHVMGYPPQPINLTQEKSSWGW